MPSAKKKKKTTERLQDEALVIGHEAGTGKNTGRCGALRCQNGRGAEFKLGRLKDDIRMNPPVIGRWVIGFRVLSVCEFRHSFLLIPDEPCVIYSVVTYKFSEMCAAGVPKWPVFARSRPDMDANIIRDAIRSKEKFARSTDDMDL